MNLIPLYSEKKLQSCKNHLNKENLNEFKEGTLMEKSVL